MDNGSEVGGLRKNVINCSLNILKFRSSFHLKQKDIDYLNEKGMDVIYIGADLPSEYSGSKYTHSIKGTNAKAKANAVSGLPEIIETASGSHFRKNQELKHKRHANDGKRYLYDIIDIKKETSNSLGE